MALTILLPVLDNKIALPYSDDKARLLTKVENFEFKGN